MRRLRRPSKRPWRSLFEERGDPGLASSRNCDWHALCPFSLPCRSRSTLPPERGGPPGFGLRPALEDYSNWVGDPITPGASAMLGLPLSGGPMIPFLQLPVRKSGALEQRSVVRPVLGALVLTLILLLQIGLVVWMFIQQ